MQPFDDDNAIAVIGFAGRFPGTKDVDEFWRHLLAGDELITRFPGTWEGGATPAHGITPEAEWFDAGFFDYSPAEAMLIDPQQRVFLECCSEALERAGCDPSRYSGAIGVYAGIGGNAWMEQLRAAESVAGASQGFQLHVTNTGDFVTMRVAYKLGLRGPAITVQTTCSTSLVAVHLAVQSLLAGECDVALAGGVSLQVPHPIPIPYDGGALAFDGYCRPFDARAQGTVSGDGAGVVVLKPLPEAIADGDHVNAVIRGSAVNNDGSDKIGFTAPSIAGQAAAIRTAYAVAGIDPATVGYVEAHGAATSLGDPIEISALTKAFQDGSGRTGFCRIGSVKSNIGHTDIAAGVIGLIKTVLAVEHGRIPASLHFEKPNPNIDFDSSPFVVNSELTEWPETDFPRRAGINSLGLGGTNAHVVIEQATLTDAPADATGPHLLPLSARTEEALADSAARLADHLCAHPDIPLADVAWTLQSGRREFEYRTHVVATAHEAAASLLRAAGQTGTRSDLPPLTFLFPGQGSQYPGMARELYASWPVFRDRVDECTGLLEANLGASVRKILLADPSEDRAFAAAGESLDQIDTVQLTLFTLEYSLAGLWQSWGIYPSSVLGHSLGAYAAACTAGVLSVADALALVVERGRLLGLLPAGAMLAVFLSEADLRSCLHDELSVAAVNGASQCVVSGARDAVAKFQADLDGQGIASRRIRSLSAFHSHLLDPVLDEFGSRVRTVELRVPEIPWISDMHGRMVSPDEARDPRYWVEHLRQPVRFADALSTLLGTGPGILLEVGPGNTLINLARRHQAASPEHAVLGSLPGEIGKTSARSAVLSAAGGLWSRGFPLAWDKMQPARRRRVPLPTYPFQRKRFAPSALGAGPSPGPAPSTAPPVRGPRASGRPGPRQARTAATAMAEQERLLAGVFSEVLGLSEVMADDNFFDLGGDSLIAVRLAEVIRRVFGVKIPVRAILLAPTVSELLPHLSPQEEKN
jgi:phthiocerol/phenolphthiocerol synthesis type-I polyketide synthase E